MARAAEIATGALVLCGVMSPGALSARPRDLSTALDKLATLVAHLAGTRTLMWLRRTWSIQLIADTPDYPLRPLTELPSGCCEPRWIESWFRAELLRAGRREPLTLWREDEWQRRDEWCNPRPGRPHAVWVDKLDEPILRPWPVPNEDDLIVELTGTIMPQALAENQGANVIPMPGSWQLYLEHATAALISAGAVVRLDPGTRDRIEGAAKTALAQIDAVPNREHQVVQLAEPYAF